MTTYTGTVKVGGPADVRQAGKLEITKVEVGPYGNNAYLLRCTETGELVLIDAANDAATLLELIGGRPLAKVITTHRHNDHWYALEEVVQATGATVVAHPEDADRLPVQVEPVRDGDTVAVGSCTLRVIHLVGHTPGSIALVYDGDGELVDSPHIFTGDSLFPGGPGNTEKDAGRFTSLMNDLEAKVFGTLPDATWVYPGHGVDTTLGAERPSVPEWRARGW